MCSLETGKSSPPEAGKAKLRMRQLRLVSGLVLLLFSAMHLTNLAFGLHSARALDSASNYLMRPWGTGLGSLALLIAVVIHIGMGLISIGQRRSVAMSRTDWVQMVLGILITPLLLNHVMVVGVLRQISPDFKPDFDFLLVLYWKYSPVSALQQILVLVILWVHGAIGFYQWLVLKPVWRRVGPILTPALFLIPILALLGFVEGGKDTLAALETTHQGQQKIDLLLEMMAQAKPELAMIQKTIILVYGVLILAALISMVAKILRRYGKPVTITYDNGITISGQTGLSILEMSMLNHIPHANVCGGRGRCGTCLVSTQHESGLLSPINQIEAHTLARLKADGNKRLGCQARLLAGDISVTRLQPAFVDAEASRNPFQTEIDIVTQPGDVA